MKGISVVIPVYNSGENLLPLLQRIETVCLGVGQEFEVILVDDDSKDGSWRAIEEFSAERPYVRGFRMMRNFGQHSALLAGIREARFPITVTLDDDLQNQPEDIPKLLEKLSDGYDLVYGCRERERNGLIRDGCSVLFKVLLGWMTGMGHAKNISSFKAFRTSLRLAFEDCHAFVLIDVILSWGTTRIGTVTVRHQEREFGKSTYTFRKLAKHAISLVTGFSLLPLRIAIAVGFTFVIFGGLLMSYVMYSYFSGYREVPGFTFLAAAICMFSGVQLFSLGVIGEYISRIYVRMIGKPSYVISERTGA